MVRALLTVLLLLLTGDVSASKPPGKIIACYAVYIRNS